MSEKSTVVLDGHLLDTLFLKRITSYKCLETTRVPLRSTQADPASSFIFL